MPPEPSRAASADATLALPLPTEGAVLPVGHPFTRAQAHGAGLGRAQLDRLLAAGRLRRLLRGVYVDADVVLDRPLRAEAARLALGEGAVAAGRTAAWVWGLEVGRFDAASLVPLQRTRAVHGAELARVATLGLTTPLRTLLDLGTGDRPEVALAAMDRFLGLGLLSHRTLLASLAGRRGRGSGRLRVLAVQADARARGPAESVLRLHWHASRLPTPVPALVVPTPHGALRLALAVPTHRFGALVLPVAETSGASGSPAASWLRDQGWWLVGLPEDRLLRGEPELWCRHLEREWHQQLLAEVC